MNINRILLILKYTTLKNMQVTNSSNNTEQNPKS